MAKVNPIPEGYPQVIPYLYVDGAARAIDVIGARPRRADEVDPLDQRAAAVLEPEQDHRGHDVVEVGRAERAGKAHGRMRVLADADEVDVASAVDLSS